MYITFSCFVVVCFGFLSGVVHPCTHLYFFESSLNSEEQTKINKCTWYDHFVIMMDRVQDCKLNVVLLGDFNTDIQKI